MDDQQAADRIGQYIERLLSHRRPEPFVPTDDETEALRAAIELSAAHPADATPRPQFLSDMRDRLAAQAERPAAQPQRRRRSLLAGAGVAAASAAVAVVVDRSVVSPAPAASGTLDPADGEWQTVASSAELGEGGARTFDTGTVAGYLSRVDGVLTARSGVCTHQGCRLMLNLPLRRLDCPCHRTAFALDGTVEHSQLPTPPARLPAIQVREHNGQIQVYLPPRR